MESGGGVRERRGLARLLAILFGRAGWEEDKRKQSSRG
jgi:hypothetical protein